MYAGVGRGKVQGTLGVWMILVSIVVFVLGGSTYLLGVLLGIIGGSASTISGREASSV